MNHDQSIRVNPWPQGGNGAASLPAGSVFVAAHDINLFVDSFPELAFLSRAEDRDELWVVISPEPGPINRYFVGTCYEGNSSRYSLGGSGKAASAPRQGDDAQAARRLLETLYRRRVGFAWTHPIGGSDLVSLDELNAIVDGIEQELDRNAERARSLAKETEIVRVARELGLNPELRPGHHRVGVGQRDSGRQSPSGPQAQTAGGEGSAGGREPGQIRPHQGREDARGGGSRT